jgi:hypothetical protein
MRKNYWGIIDKKFFAKKRSLVYGRALEKYPFLKNLEKKESLEIFSNLENTKWQKIYVVFSLLLTFALIGVTIFYAIQTSRLNDMTANQFEFENKPYFYFWFHNTEIIGDRLKTKVTVENLGEIPGRLVEIAVFEKCGRKTSVKEFSIPTLVRSKETQDFEYLLENFSSEITSFVVYYTGIGEMNDLWNYSVSIEEIAQGKLRIFEGEI